jgi:hypothetical protein
MGLVPLAVPVEIFRHVIERPDGERRLQRREDQKNSLKTRYFKIPTLCKNRKRWATRKCYGQPDRQLS